MGKYDKLTDEEVQYIRDHKDDTIEQLCNALYRSATPIRAKRIELFGYRNSKAWTEEEDAFLMENLQTMSIIDLSSKLGRTPNAINARKRTIGMHVKCNGERLARGVKMLCWRCKWSTNPAGNPCTWSGRDKHQRVMFKVPEGAKIIKTIKAGTGCVDEVIVECPLFVKG